MASIRSHHLTNNNPSLTNTTSITSIPVSRPNNNVVTFEFNTDLSRPGLTRISLPKGSTWTPGAHWHESYTEYLLVKQGRVKVVLDGKERVVTSKNGPQVVARGVVHDWMRADKGAGDDELDDEEVVVEEWTDPDDGVKQVFFRNLFGVVTDKDTYWKSWMFIQMTLIADVYDNYVDMVPAACPRWVSRYTTHTLYGANRTIARMIGLRPWYEQYTPVELREAAAAPPPLEKQKSW